MLLALGVVYLIRNTLFVFAAALLLAYLLYPLVDFLDRHLPSKTRTPALALTYLIVMGSVITIGVFVGSVAADQAVNLAKGAPAFLQKIQQTPAPGPGSVESVKEEITGFVQRELAAHYNEYFGMLPKVSMDILKKSGNLIYIVVLPILSFFILRDGRRVRNWFLDILPTGRRASMEETLMDIHTLLLQYMRALLILCLATFTSFSIVLSVFHVPYALLLSTIAFSLEFIPLVGPLIAALTIVTVAFLSGFPHVLAIIIFLGLYRLFQDYILSPNLMSHGVELHPMLVIFGVFAGGSIGGVEGIFLSIPVLALIRLFYHRLNRLRATDRLKAA